MSRGDDMEYIRLLLIFLLLLSSCIIEVVEVDEAPSEQAYVSRVVDGDTVVLESGEKVRFVGINTPEKWEYYYGEATQGLRDLVENKSVILTRDVSDRDKYNRILRYVYLEDGTFVNARMVEQGFARAYYYPPDTRHYDYFVELETVAKEKNLGIWNLSGLERIVQEQYPQGCNYVASKTGEVYYSVECKYANRILEKNRLCFKTADDAVQSGYRLTKKC